MLRYNERREAKGKAFCGHIIIRTQQYLHMCIWCIEANVAASEENVNWRWQLVQRSVYNAVYNAVIPLCVPLFVFFGSLLFSPRFCMFWGILAPGSTSWIRKIKWNYSVGYMQKEKVYDTFCYNYITKNGSF